MPSEWHDNPRGRSRITAYEKAIHLSEVPVYENQVQGTYQALTAGDVLSV